MDGDERSHLQELIRVYTQRLRRLELEAARYGGSSPPHVVTEIEEIQHKIAELEQRNAIRQQETAREVGTHEEAQPTSQQPAGPAGPLGCPYPGMIAFRADDARFFYGRDAEIQQMIQHLRYRRLLFVIGPSGSGKSSLIHAGLLPRLQRSNFFAPGFWLVRELRPGLQPATALARALGGEPGAPAIARVLETQPEAQRLLLVIDQFEELFTLASRAERIRCIAMLRALQKVRQCALLLAMRADFYADLMSTDLWPIEASQRLDIAPLRTNRLREALRRPAAELGVEVAPGLLDRLLADAADEPGALPLLQETMTVLWAEMSAGALPLSAYERLSASGRGLAVALAAKADAVIDELTAEQRRIACRILLRLVQFGEGRADTRRQQTIAALRSADDDPALFEHTLQWLTDNRLLTLSNAVVYDERPTMNDERRTIRSNDLSSSVLCPPSFGSTIAEAGLAAAIARPAAVLVDLAHEALIAGWPTLQRWLAERREAERTRRRLEAHVAEWVRLGRGVGGLLDAVVLDEVDRWLASPEAAEVGYDHGLRELVQASRAAMAEAVLRQLSEQARRHAADTLLHDIAQKLTSVLAPDEITTLILDELRRVVAYDNATLVLRQGNWLRITAARGFADTLHAQIGRLRFGIADDPTIARIFHAREPLVLDDLQTTRPVVPLDGGMPIHGWIGAPLLLDGQPTGLLAVGSKAIGAYADEDAQLVFALASLAAQSIRNVRLFDEVHSFAAEMEQHVVERTAALAEANQLLSDEKARLRVVHAITHELAQSLDLEATLTKALDLVSKAVGVQNGSIMLRDLASEALIRRAVLSGGSVGATSDPISFAGGPGLAGWVMAQRQTACIADVHGDPRWLREAGRADEARSVVAVPLIAKGEMLGVLMLSSPRVDYFGEAQIQLITTIANEIAIVLYNAELYSFVIDQSLRLSELLEQQRRETGKSQAILQSISEGVIVLDEDLVILFNPAAEQVLGIAAEAILQRPIAQLLRPADMGAAARRIELIHAALTEGLQALDQGEDDYSRLLELPAPPQSIMLRFAEIVQPFGSRYGAVIVLSDITSAIEADRANRDFITSVSRELRDPLTSIRGYADLLLMNTAGSLNQAQQALLGIVKNNANRLTDLNNAIQMIGLIDSERIKRTFSFEPVDIEALLRESIWIQRREIGRKRLMVQVAVAARIPMLRTDKWHVEYVAQQLLSNAIKYSYPGRQIALRAFRRTDGLLQVDVEDTGVGISPEQQQHLFRRFYRADNPMRDATDGAGLGLSIARSVVELLGGELWLHSSTEQGSTFCFTLPPGDQEQLI
jgi:signal transduction histidine kinase/putative methionine-R-sulfoxide reductase with GAF domain